MFNLLSARPTKWSNRLKKFVSRCTLKNVFDHLVGLALKGLIRLCKSQCMLRRRFITLYKHVGPRCGWIFLISFTTKVKEYIDSPGSFKASFFKLLRWKCKRLFWIAQHNFSFDKKYLNFSKNIFKFHKDILKFMIDHISSPGPNAIRESVFVRQNDINIFSPSLESLEHVTSRISGASS